MSRASIFTGIALLLTCITTVARADIDAVAKTTENATHWHFSDATLTATFLGSDKPEPADLILNKSPSLARAITISTDGNYVVVESNKPNLPHVVFQFTAKPEGTTSKLLLVGGDQPTLFFDDKEQLQQQGKWIQIFGDSETTLKLEIGSATFARVTFDPPTNSKPAVAANPAPPPAAPADPKSVELLHNVTARQLQLASDKFHAAVDAPCTRCNGTGKVSVRVQIGTHQEGGLSYPTYKTEIQKCTKCNGTGIQRATDDVIIKVAGSLVKALANVKEDDPAKQTTETAIYKEITDNMIGDRDTWTLLTANGRSILAQRDPAPGTTVVALVRVQESVKSGQDHRRYRVRVVGTDMEVLVDDPELADELKSKHALMGGLVDKSLPNPNGTGHITVLKAGFLICPQVKKDWWWWYKDRT